MDVNSKLDVLVKIINSCDTYERLNTVRTFISKTKYFSDDEKLFRTALLLVDVADIYNVADRKQPKPDEYYECSKYIEMIKTKRGFIKETSN